MKKFLMFLALLCITNIDHLQAIIVDSIQNNSAKPVKYGFFKHDLTSVITREQGKVMLPNILDFTTPGEDLLFVAGNLTANTHSFTEAGLFKANYDFGIALFPLEPLLKLIGPKALDGAGSVGPSKEEDLNKYKTFTVLIDVNGKIKIVGNKEKDVPTAQQAAATKKVDTILINFSNPLKATIAQLKDSNLDSFSDKTKSELDNILRMLEETSANIATYLPPQQVGQANTSPVSPRR